MPPKPSGTEFHLDIDPPENGAQKVCSGKGSYSAERKRYTYQLAIYDRDQNLLRWQSPKKQKIERQLCVQVEGN